MVLHQEGSQLAQKPKRFRTYFKVCGTVLTDTLANQIYGIDLPQLKQKAEEAKSRYPRISKTIEYASKYSFWVGLAYLGASVSRHVGPVLGYTLTYSHPFILGTATNSIRRQELPLKEMKPNLPTYLATFSLLELASTPLYLSIIEKSVHLARDAVSASLAAISLITGIVAALTFEYLGFVYIWRKFVLRDPDKGSLKDGVRGFFSEFHPFSSFKSETRENPANNMSEYIGQIWGVTESVWIWMRLASIIVAVAITQVYFVEPGNFIDLYYQKSAEWGKRFLEALMIAKCCMLVENKIKENNEHLEIEK